MAKWALVAHGGAGVIQREHLKPEQDLAYREAMAAATRAGAELLRDGGAALDAVEAAVRVLEDDPLFNAGRGAVFTAEGKNELDAAMMDGRNRAAGAVAGVTRTRHPIVLARAVMEKSPHVFLIGEGADAFSQEQGLEQAEPAWFFTERRWRALEKDLTTLGLPIPTRPQGVSQNTGRAALAHDEGPTGTVRKFGTVGVAARDAAGNLAAGTSTGGTTAKRWGRVGDSPLIGAGTYADNASCAVSATGTGEYFIRLSVAKRVCDLVELAGLSLQAAVDRVVQDEVKALGGDGGVIAVGADGEPVWSFNTSGMYRARIAEGEAMVVGIYKDDP